MKKEKVKYFTYEDGSKYRIPEIGDKFRVIKKCRSFENGWEAGWDDNMDKTIGMVGRVRQIGDRTLCVYLIFNDTEWWYPLFVLGPAKNGLERLVERYEEKNKKY